MRPDLDAIALRLRARNQTIERALAVALAHAGLARGAIGKLASLAHGANPERVEEHRRRIEAEPGAPGVSWEELCRPSLEALSARNPRSLRRA